MEGWEHLEFSDLDQDYSKCFCQLNGKGMKWKYISKESGRVWLDSIKK